MKLNLFVSAMLIGGLCLSTTGCALLDKSKKYVVRGSSGEVNESSDEDAQVLTPPKEGGAKSGDKKNKSTGKAVKNKKKKGKGKKQAVSKEELADARRDVAELESAAQGVVAAVDSTAMHGNLLPENFTVNGEWTIYSVRDNIVTGEERPYLTFDIAAKRFYGSNGCNVVNGDLTVGDAQSIALENVISTMKMCQDAPYEYLINLALADVKSFGARQDGTVTFLDLKNAEGSTVMVLRRHNMDFLNGAWKITNINGVPLIPVEGEEVATMTINIPDMKIHGTTGCNIFNGALFIDPDKTDSMQFIDIVTTRMACPPGAHETEVLLALEGVETAKCVDNNTIEMFDVDGKELFKMTRIEFNPAEE